MRQRTMTDRTIDGVADLDEDGAAGQVKGGGQLCFRRREREVAERPTSPGTLDPDDEDLEVVRGEQEVDIGDGFALEIFYVLEPILHGGLVDEVLRGTYLEGFEGRGDRSRMGWLRHVNVLRTAEEQAGLEGVVEAA